MVPDGNQPVYHVNRSISTCLSRSTGLWDNQCCEVQADQLLDAAVDDVERSRYLASRDQDPVTSFITYHSE